MPVGDVWGNSWGASWNSFWQQATAAVAPTATATSAGSARRGSATQWAYKTLGQLEREKKREAAKLKKLARKAIRLQVSRGVIDLDTLLEQATERVDQEAPSYDWLTDEYSRMIALTAMRGIGELIERRLADEDDAEAILLLAA